MEIDRLQYVPLDCGTLCLFQYLGPDYMSRAGPVSRAGVSLPASRHVC